ncbi:type II 3-dehydroquinate dehydratase [uncultured Boseongicola sp.]|jgi:3-dehydroquinate dehydratase-2|uniref:type II 3-dehydroquinate dehydratase n=1 Tax=uncultured Boseongicola sp. TaxID=1648499 RepID=UPI00260C381E|nr:type II 3-dehydroquinate dehydratase [uncultured Boseongicola sp.]
MASLLILNGPNLNLLGTRQPDIYGTVTLADIEVLCRDTAAEFGMDIECLQSNHEGALVDAIHAARGTHSGIVLNAGAYSHTSVALHDAIVGTEIAVIEVHISNIHARESFRHHSFITPAALGMISGVGVHGYSLAVRALAEYLNVI